ncbi:MAG: 16S rRNA (uracil(1498)-N(3))-methyltransferase [Acidobacteriota bacterium]|nr:MAG: 16S rRNA (uracil(1498)-N(3))-methyltransferase [Acidobacteriota bacterium]
MSRERRFFVPELSASHVELTDDQAHHLTHVLRLNEGDAVTLFDGKGHAARATISRIDSDIVALEVGDPLPANESPLSLTLAVAVPKGDTMPLIVQKLTELGVATIQPLLTDNGEINGEAICKRIERWQRVSLEAAKQCGRSQLPFIETPRPFEALARPDAVVLTPGAPPLDSSEKLSPNAVVLVGPEGGWSGPELHLAKDRDLTVFGLGPRTMRTETAAVAAATLMQWLGGDLR